MTKFQRNLYENYLRAEDVTIWDAYGSPSVKKVRAYEHCVHKCLENNGGPWCIPTHNTFAYTFAYTFHKDGVKWLHYETSCNVYEFPIV